jgi:hypothetical protein
LDPPAGIEVGDAIRVKLVSLNVERGFIDFVRAAKQPAGDAVRRD